MRLGASAPVVRYIEMATKSVLITIMAAAATLAAADFRQAVIVVGPNPSPRTRKAARMLAEEIETRTQLRLKTAASPAAGQPSIAIKGGGGGPAEGYLVTVSGGAATVTGNDDRGVVFGTGLLLRRFKMSRQRLEIED